MDSILVPLLFLLSILIHGRLVVGSCPVGCRCDLFSISCCDSDSYFQLPITGFPNATKLSLLNCPSLNISRKSVQKLNRLEEIVIQRTHVVYIDGNAFVDFPMLKSIFLNELNLSAANVHPSAFNNLPIQHLDLSENNLKIVTRQLFSGLRNLRVLDLSRNKISLIQNLAFENLQQLTVLNLDHNNLKTVTPFWFKSFSNYSSLRISIEGNNMTDECNFRGIELAENQWFIQSITPNNYVASKKTPVHSCSTPTFNDPYHEIYVMESTSVAMACSATSIPEPVLSWLLPTGLEVSSISNGTLNLTKVRPTDSGLYACVATNSEGSAVAITKLSVISTNSPTVTINLLTPNIHAKKASLVLLIIFIVILLLALCLILFYILKSVYRLAKAKMDTGFEFNRFVDTPSILPVPENPQPMPHV
ncbi:uncharacterized protein WCC33_016042 [Rhinophrynus dorsalis]